MSEICSSGVWQIIEVLYMDVFILGNKIWIATYAHVQHAWITSQSVVLGHSVFLQQEPLLWCVLGSAGAQTQGVAHARQMLFRPVTCPAQTHTAV